MEDYLRDSPFDEPTRDKDTKHDNQDYPGFYQDSLTGQQNNTNVTQHSQNTQSHNQNLDYPNNGLNGQSGIEGVYEQNTYNLNTNDFNFEFTPTYEQTFKQEPLDGTYNSTDYTSIGNVAGTYDYTSPGQNNQETYTSPGVQPAMPANDPYFEAFDFLGLPSQQPVASPNAEAYTDPLQFNMNDPLNNLDQLISPDNGGGNMFLSAQHFSPAARNFNLLSLIAEDSLPGSYHNTFSPNLLRHGSISVPPLNNGGYLSPSNTFTSPHLNPYEGLLDTLKSPLGSYINSPPPQLALSRSIPSGGGAAQLSIGSALSPPQFGLPNTRKPDYSKQLTQEEKAKRRREFHNAVERRRRDLIKEKIKELGQLVPPSLLTPQVCAVQTLLKQPHLNSKEIKELIAMVKVKEAKPNKAVILMTSVDYIRHLKLVSERQITRRAELEREIAELEGQTTSGTPASFPSTLDIPPLSGLEFNPDDFFSDVVTEI